MSTHGERLGRLLRLHARVSEMQTLLSLIRLASGSSLGLVVR